MAYITNVDSTVLPYNDDDMKYDIDLRMYILTPSGFTKYTGMDIRSYTDDDNEVNAFAIEASSDIYELGVYANSQLNYVKFKRYLIAKDANVREDFKRALAYQWRYALRSGGNLLKDMHGINIEKGKGMDINQLRGSVTIALESERILKRLGLLYSGYMYLSSFEDDGTY